MKEKYSATNLNRNNSAHRVQTKTKVVNFFPYLTRERPSFSWSELQYNRHNVMYDVLGQTIQTQFAEERERTTAGGWLDVAF